MPTILVADDHGLYRRGLRIALQDAIPQSEIIEVDTLNSALSVLDERPGIDLALIDLAMPGVGSLTALSDVRRLFPRTRFIILSALESAEVVLSTLGAGLHGYISKAQPDAEIIGAVLDTLSGRIYVPPWLSQTEERVRVPDPSHRSSDILEAARLTPRQQEVLALIAEGLSNNEIANRLAIAEPTTKIHVAALMRAMNVRNRTEAALKAKLWLSDHPEHRGTEGAM